MYPVAPVLVRTVTNSFDFAGYRIPAGENVMIATTVPHYLPECFPEPDRFDIDRYTPERAEHRQPEVYAPFGLRRASLPRQWFRRGTDRSDDDDNSARSRT